MAKLAIQVEDNTIERYEGDDSIIVLQYDDTIDLSNSELVFHIGNFDETPILSKTNQDGGGITYATEYLIDEVLTQGQFIIIDIEDLEMESNTGVFRWEIKATKDSDYERITIGKGDFIIPKQLIKQA